MNNNMLISTAVINAFWEQSHKDLLDLLLPFLKYAIYEKTNTDQKLDIVEITNFFQNEFGYDSIPINVIRLMLDRLSPSILSKSYGDYYLNYDLTSEIDFFKKKRTECKTNQNKVGKSLSEFLNSKKLLSTIDCDTALNYLITFFVDNGICLIKDPKSLELIRTQDDRINYLIAQFIKQELEKQSDIFDCILSMVKGFFVSTAISFQPTNSSLEKANFKQLRCFLDTRIIINALGLHREEAKKASLEFIEMLKEKRAILCCFEHNYQEIKEIINAYKATLNNPSQSMSHHTLEAWDLQCYTVSDVERYSVLLRNKIESLGITIQSEPSCDNDGLILDEKGLIDAIKGKINYQHEIALTRDVRSISAIYKFRNGIHGETLEKCNYIFVTNNISLANVSNSYLSKLINNKFPLTITDSSLSSIVWLKTYSTHSDYPKQRLIENASAALEPSSSFVSTLFEKLEKLKNEGGITEDEATIIRVDLLCKRELYAMANGDDDSITDDNIYSVRDNLKKHYSQEQKKETDRILEKYSQEREKHAKARQKAINTIDSIKDSCEKTARKYLKIVASVVLLGISAVFVYSLILNIGNPTKATIIVFIFDALGLLDIVSSKIGFISKLISVLASKKSEKKVEKKKKEYRELFGEDF